MIEYKLIEDVKPKSLISAYVLAPFDEGKKLLESRGYRIISLEENARLRILEGYSSKVSQYGNWVLEDAIYVPSKGVFLTKNSPIMDNAETAVEEQRNGRDFYINPNELEKYLEGAVRLDDKSIPTHRYRTRIIPTNRFNEFEITNYAFGELAEDYGNFLKENGIKEMLIWLANMQDKPFVRKLWFWRIGNYRSELDCNYRNLFNEDRLCGVSEMSAEYTKKILGEKGNNS